MSETLQFHLDKVLEHVSDATISLPQDIFYFVSQLTPMINVDLLIKNKAGQVLLTWRDDRFYGPAWHLPGGIIRFKETFESRVTKVAEIELGASVKFLPEPIHVRGLINPYRNIRGHFISLLFLCELTSELDSGREHVSGVPRTGQWAWHDKAPSNLLKAHEGFRAYIDDTPPL